jgi:hypothetical protein
MPERVGPRSHPERQWWEWRYPAGPIPPWIASRYYDPQGECLQCGRFLNWCGDYCYTCGEVIIPSVFCHPCLHTGESIDLDYCPICKTWKNPDSFDWHHVSYEHDRTVYICRQCHSRVHNEAGFYDWLNADMSRAEAKSHGFV